MTGHCDAQVLAEFREGLLSRRRSARIRAHLAACPRCASLSQGLAEVSTLLAAAPAPRMPGELAARLDAALAAEAAARALAADSPAAAAAGAATDGSPAVAGRNGHGAAARTPRRPLRLRPARDARPPRPWRVTALRAASATAAVLVIAGGGYGVSRLAQGGHALPASAASGGSHTGAKSPVRNTRAGGNNSDQVNTGVSPRELPVHRSGTDYRPGRLSAEAAAALAHPGRVATDVSPLDREALRGCALLVTGGVKPSLVDLARYQGRQATIIVLAGAGGRPGQVWVVGPGCSSAHRDLIARAALTGTG